MSTPLDRLTQRLTPTPVLRPTWDFLVTTGAFLGWYVAFHSRDSVITLSCTLNPSSCDPSSLNWLDRKGLINDYHRLADHLSYWTQDAAGVLAAVCFIAFSVNRRTIWTQLLLLFQATFFNGAIIEAIRLIVQRPRPFVYLNPMGQGGVAAHYTSFYSGHTSFAALASTLAIVAVWNAHHVTRKSVITLGVLLTASTGLLRVVAGRHFITDVVFGALAGAAIAIAVNSLHHQSLARRAKET